MINKKPENIARKITIIYLIIGALWILLSDKLVGLLVAEKEMVTFFSLIKGCFYVTITGVIIYYLINNSLTQLKKTELELIKICDEYSVANKKLEKVNKELEASQIELENQYQQALINQQQIKDSEERYRLVSEGTNDAIWQEFNGNRTFSDRWFEITGYSKSDLEEAGSWENFIHPEDKAAAKEKMLIHKRERSNYYQCQYRFRIKNGHYIWIQARGKAAFDNEGNSYLMAGSHTDITALKEYEQKLQHLAYHDPLTGLKNRSYLNDRLNCFIVEEKKDKYALLYIDIDNFKYVNDTMGHRFGDLLLIMLGERLLQLSIENSMVFRIGGDEFVVLVENYTGKDELEKIAVKILKAFKPHFEVESMSIYITVSIGISTYPEQGNDINSLLKNADIAVYKAKESGKNRIVFYNTPMIEEITERMKIEKHLRKALNNNEFELFYQPQFDIHDGKISGFEALIRWKSPELGFVSPQKFIGVAEETHLIIAVGEWVIRAACQFMSNLEKIGYTGLDISINISMLQLLQEDFVEMVIENIEIAQLNPSQVELEITESILMESYEVIAGKLKKLRVEGVRIALDDFGKGYSSLNYLKQLPITTLKIDKSFIDTISNKDRNKSLTDLIVKLGRSMNLSVVAEGVETHEQMQYLVKHKCHKIQGYLFSKPIPEEEVLRKLHDSFSNELINIRRN